MAVTFAKPTVISHSHSCIKHVFKKDTLKKKNLHSTLVSLPINLAFKISENFKLSNNEFVALLITHKD